MRFDHKTFLELLRIKLVKENNILRESILKNEHQIIIFNELLRDEK